MNMELLPRGPLNIDKLRRFEDDQHQRLPIAALALYDATMAFMADEAGVDVLLVGDSLGMVVQGHESTLPVSLNDAVYHTQCVSRGLESRGNLRRSWLIADLPFGSYSEPKEAFDSAVLLMKAGAQMVKLEGGALFAPHVEYLVHRGIPVCAHLGLTPQSIHLLGGYRVQGRTEEAAKKMLADALVLQKAGASMLVLEMVPALLTEEIVNQLDILTIGIGAGKTTDGQILVAYDVLGMSKGKLPKFSHNFLLGEEGIQAAFKRYVFSVRQKDFPKEENQFV